MASVMGICAGLVGSKSGNVENVLFFDAFLNDPMVQNNPHAAAADPDGTLTDRSRGGPGSRYSSLEARIFGNQRSLYIRACGHKGRGPIYGLPPLPPTSFIRRSALVAHRMSLVCLNAIF